MVLEDFQRFLVILIERAKARLFEVYAGEIQEHSGVLNEVPARVKRGGFGGSEERRIERHIDDHVRRHFKNVADKANELVRRSGVDFLILGGTDQNVHDFHYYLNNVLHDKLAGQIQEDQNATPKTVLAKTLKIEQDLRQKNEKKLLDRFFGRIRSGGLALLGLDPTIRALQQGQVNTIVIQDGYARSGYRCKACSSLLANNTSCDYCGGATERVNDIVDAAIQEALQQGCNVKFITLDDSPLAAAGSIGALLRFRL
jgi:peptide chain release factor subunit 1